MKTASTYRLLIGNTLACVCLGACSVGEDSSIEQSETRVDIQAFRSAEVCRSCHPDHYEQWSLSAHRYAMHDPVFQALTLRRQDDLLGHEDGHCTACHSPIATRSGDVRPGDTFEQLAPISLEGVTCEACHKVSGLDRPNNAGHQYDPEGPMFGTLPEGSESPFHGVQFSSLHQTSEFCAGCHDVIEEAVVLEQPYQEWSTSTSSQNDVACQSCHMRSRPGYASPLGPWRESVHDHTFVGVDIPIDGGELTEEERETLRTSIEGLLANTASMGIEPVDTSSGALTFHVSVTNDVEGHNLPTGSTFYRQMWIELIVFDASGEPILSRGTLDENGRLSNVGDEDIFHSTLVDVIGEPTWFPWEAEEHIVRSLAPHERRNVAYELELPDAIQGPIDIEARLLFRPFSVRLLEALELDEFAENLPIYEITSAHKQVDLEDLEQ